MFAFKIGDCLQFLLAMIVNRSSWRRRAEQSRGAEDKAEPMFMRAQERGFTMAELMIALGVGAILMALAAPPLMSMIATQRLKTTAFDLYSAMSYARSEAIKRDAVVTIVPRGGTFTNGYDLVVGGTTLRSQAGSRGVAVSAPPGVTLAFDGYGRLTVPVRYQLELTSGQVTTAPRRCVIIGTSGHPSIRVDKNRDGNCING